MTRVRKRLIAFLLLLVTATAGVIHVQAAEEGTGTPEFKEFSELSGKRVSMLNGAPFEELVSSKVPDVGEFSYFANMADMTLALSNDKTDAILLNNAVSQLAVNRNPGLAMFPQNLQDSVFGIAFAKGDKKRDTWQAAFDSIPKKELDAAWEKWTGSDESVKVMPEQDWPGSGGTVQVAACDTLEPMSYAGEGGELKGFDLEVILMMAKKLDVHVEFIGMEFSAILAYVQSGKALMGVGSIIVTDERKESVDFIEYYPAAFVLMVRSVQSGGETGNDTTDQGNTTDQSNNSGLEALKNGVAAVLTGTIDGEVTQEVMPDVKLKFFNSQADCIAALESGKVDFMPMDEPIARYMQIENDKLEIAGTYHDTELAAVFPKTDAGQALCDQYSEFIDKLWEDGTMKEIDSIWFGTDEEKKTVLDYKHLPDTNGTLCMAIDATMPPFAYLNGRQPVGYDVDIAARFCEANGYRLKVEVMDFGGILPAVQSGKSDFSSCCITVTEERAQSVLFSSPNYHSCVAAVVMKNGAGGASEDDSDEGIWASFEKTFIREDRWKLYVSGIITTLIITLLSAIFGTIVGFGVFLLCRRGNPVANGITRFCMWVIQGMPMVVLLMVLYYIIFGNVSISGVAVAVIGFTLTFGSAVFGLLKMGVGAVDNGQYEGAYALGYSNHKTFFRIILPQALPHIMPAYKGEIVNLIKATAVVGYIAVQDLTKIGDIVRSRTYEAFFPLIALTIIYFLLEGLLGFAVSRIHIKTDPRRRSREKILMGVKTDD